MFSLLSAISWHWPLGSVAVSMLVKRSLNLLYVEDHLLLFESMVCMDNVLVEELTLC